jgi:molybdopterin-guanine dinucleotide biosynthesis protein A
MIEAMTAAAQPEAAGFVLAGGASSRMGRDKAQLVFGGKPLVERALALLREAGLTASIAGARAPLEQFAQFAPVIPDAEPGLGPLGGICTAMVSTSARFAVFLTVDAPFLPAALIRLLLRHAAATGRAVTLASVGGKAQSFPVVLDRSMLPFLQSELAAGRAACMRAFLAAAAALGEPPSLLPVEWLLQSGQIAHPACLPAVHWFLNLNSAVDLDLAERLLRSNRVI